MIAEIPLYAGVDNAHQDFSVQLGENYTQWAVDYKPSLNQWSVNISIDNVTIVSGAMLEPNCDIIETWRLSDTLGRLIFVGDDVTLDNLGIDNNLIWYSPDE